MEISFEIPEFILQVLQSLGEYPNQVAKELVLVGWFRRGLITHHQLATALGLDRCAADALLKRHQVSEHPLDHDDVDADV